MTDTFGDFVKHRRLALDIGLREYAAAVGMEASNYSKIERGLKRAPTGARLLPFVDALEFARGSTDHELLEALASVANGEIPAKVLSNERLVAKLPLLLSRMGSLSDKQLDEMLETVICAHSPEVEPEPELR